MVVCLDATTAPLMVRSLGQTKAKMGCLMETLTACCLDYWKVRKKVTLCIKLMRRTSGSNK